MIDIPKPPILDVIYEQQYYCPSCEGFVCVRYKKERPSKCPNCGQKLDWKTDI